MAHYGTHPTIFGNLSDDKLMSMYRSEQWALLDEGGRQALLQETVNRAAAANGEQGACRVEFADLGPATAGVQSGNVIQLDRNRFVHDMAQQEYNGQVITVQLFDSNVQALETVLHEDIHAWQNQCLDGTIPCAAPKLLEEYQANNFDITVVQKADGTMDVGQQYLSGESPRGGYYLYYLQSTERDAHKFSEERTLNILSILEEKYGKDPSFEQYRDNVSVNGYQATVASANKCFGTETVERDINITLKNQYFHTNEPVTSKAVETAVKQEMVESLQASMRNMQDQPVGLEKDLETGPKSGHENIQNGTETGTTGVTADAPVNNEHIDHDQSGLSDDFGGIE